MSVTSEYLTKATLGLDCSIYCMSGTANSHSGNLNPMAKQHCAASVRWPGQRRHVGELTATALPALPVSPLQASLPLMGSTEHPQHLHSCCQAAPADQLALAACC